MRAVLFLLLILSLAGCDRSRLYEQNHDFEARAWIVSDQPVFEFDITDTVNTYNVYCNIRNSVKYPYSRIFINYALQDSTGVSVSKNLISAFLFEEKTGKPIGSSGLGDVYDQQIPVLKKFKFKTAGKYSLKFEQFMRTDTLAGIHAVGFRVETAATE